MKKTLRIIGFTILFLAVVYSGFTLYAIPSVRETIALATTVKPETFTELYLEDHTNLPKSNQVKNPEWFKFTVHNLEYKTMNYPFEVYIEDIDGNKAVIMKDIFKLNHDEYKTIPVYYELLYPIERGKVVVNLIDKDQAVHFWIGKSNDQILLEREKTQATQSAQPTASLSGERNGQ